MRRFIAATISTVLIVSACSNSGAAPQPARPPLRSRVPQHPVPPPRQRLRRRLRRRRARPHPRRPAPRPPAPRPPAPSAATRSFRAGSRRPPRATRSPRRCSASSRPIPNVKVDYRPLGGDYAAGMAGKFASGDVPDVFYVDAGYASRGSTRASSSRSTTTSPRRTSTRASSSRATPRSSRAATARSTACRRTATRSAWPTTRPRSRRRPRRWTSWSRCAKSLKGKDGLKAPMCLSSGLDRGLAFLYAQGGSRRLRRTARPNRSNADATKAAVQWYIDLFKNGLGMTASDLGDDWCGTSLGKEHAAITFEGGWLDPAMTQHLSGRQVHLGRDADRFVGQPRDDLVHGQLLDRRRLEEQGPGLGAPLVPGRKSTG